MLFLINTLNFFDRQIIGAVGEPIRKEFGLGDTALGALNVAFTLIYAFVGLPLGKLADKFERRKILSVGVLIWSVFTAASGLAQSFWQIFALRLGVGVGEASCAPAANSLIGDFFPATKRARATSVFMLGLPVGLALSFYVSGAVAQNYGWRTAFFVAGLPGLLCVILAFFIREPLRGAVEMIDVGAKTRAGSTFSNVFKTPTMRWLIISGALHNFNLYAISGVYEFVSDSISRLGHQTSRIRFDDNLRLFEFARTARRRCVGRRGEQKTRRRRDARRDIGDAAFNHRFSFSRSALKPETSRNFYC